MYSLSYYTEISPGYAIKYDETPKIILKCKCQNISVCLDEEFFGRGEFLIKIGLLIGMNKYVQAEVRPTPLSYQDARWPIVYGVILILSVEIHAATLRKDEKK